MSRLIIERGKRPGHVTVYLEDDRGVRHKLPDEEVEKAFLGAKQQLPTGVSDAALVE